MERLSMAAALAIIDKVNTFYIMHYIHYYCLPERARAMATKRVEKARILEDVFVIFKY
jgi:hypothetical protein